jgi:hypothetical protein
LKLIKHICRGKKLLLFHYRKAVTVFVLLNTCHVLSAQDSTVNQKDSAYYSKRKDLIDVLLSVLHKDASGRASADQNPGRVHVSGSPSIEYSLQTGIAFNLTSNLAFHTSKLPDQNISSVLITPIYTQNQQIIIPVQSSIWTKGNKWNFISDWRFLKYPEDTYGLGGYTLPDNGYKVFYYYVRFYQFAEYAIGNDMYIGGGYQLDKHWDIQEIDPVTVTDFEKYGFHNSSLSSGLSVNFLYDNRRNSINPENGFYSNILVRQNMKWIGSDNNWTGAIIDIRKFIPVPYHSKNVLAFWSYDWLTLSGTPPYLDLPSTAWDTYSNTGRGYAQSRYRSRNMIDFETEYRFAISKNGLLGGVVFGNLSSYSEVPSNRFEVIHAGYGAGLRFQFNKFSRTNICVDYAFGSHGSNGLFLNLGEVF